MIFERVQLGKIEIHDLLFHATGGIPEGGRLFSCSRGLRHSRSAFPTVGLLRNILSRGCGLALSGAALSALVGEIAGLAASFALSACCPYPGQQLFPGLALRRPIPAAVKSTTFQRGRITHTGDRGLSSRPCPAVYLPLDGAGASLFFGSLRLGLGGLILHRKSSFGRLSTFPGLGIVYISTVGNIPFIVSHLKTSFVIEMEMPA